MTSKKKTKALFPLPDHYTLEIIWNSMGIGVFTVDLERRVTSFNEAAVSITGYRVEEVIGKHCSGRVFMKPASEGTGIIAGGAVRSGIEVSGIKNILTKCLRTSNPHNVLKATIDGLKQLQPADVRRRRLA